MRAMKPTIEVWNRWREAKDEESAQQLIQTHLPLVDYHVQRLSIALPDTVDRDELHSYGLMGLYDALQKFDYQRGLKFDTYASHRVRGAIIDGLRKEDWLPRSAREKAKKIEETTAFLEQQYHRHVTDQEVAEAMGVSVDEVLKITNESYMANLLSIDQEFTDADHEDTFLAALPDASTPAPHEKMEKEDAQEQLAGLIQGLSEKEKLVLSLFYYEDLTLTEIGAVLDLTTSRISQIHSKALFKLRKAFHLHKQHLGDKPSFL